jgi:hypothetical protein
VGFLRRFMYGDHPFFDPYGALTRTVILGQALAFAGLVLFALQAPTPAEFAAVLSVATLLAAAFFAVGIFLGFLFQIPQGSRNPPETHPGLDPGQRAYLSPRTGLDDIADWLTKIIVGVGLTQLLSIPSAMAALGNALNGALGGFPGSSALAPIEAIFFGISGFFLGYAWTRRSATPMLLEADTGPLLEAVDADRQTPDVEPALDQQALVETERPDAGPTL